MRPWPYLFALLLLTLSARAAAAQDVIYAVPNGDWRLVLQKFDPQVIRGPDGKPVAGRVVGLRQALDMASPGRRPSSSCPGVYKQDSGTDGILFPRNGSPDFPITLRGMGSDTIIDGTRAESIGGSQNSVVAGMAHNLLNRLGLEVVRKADEMSTLLRPDYRGGSICFRFKDKQWIVLDNLTLRDCADAGVIALDSRYITLKNSTIVEGLYAFYAEGPNTHHILLENNTWIQDTVGGHVAPPALVRIQVRAAARAGRRAVRRARHRRRRHHPPQPGGSRPSTPCASTCRPGGGAIPRWRGKLSTNIEVYDNDFAFIRDNVLEPEYDATNWWFHGNRIRNAHAWFSFDGLYGGRWYVYDNAGWFDDRPSRECVASGSCKEWQQRNPALCGDLHDGGRVFKFRADGRYAPGPLYVFNNSWYLRASVIKDGRLGYIGHWNNAIDFCRPEDYPDGLCEDVKPFFNGFLWDVDNYSFSNDLSNHPDFPAGLRAQGYRVSGISVPQLAVAVRRMPPTATSPWSTAVRGRGAGCAIVEGDVRA